MKLSNWLFIILHILTETRSMSSSSFSQCYGKYGCFSIRYPWTSRYYFLANAEFRLYTRENPTEPHLLKENEPATVQGSQFSPNRPTFIVTHGYLEHGSKRWVIRLKDELLRKIESNVIVLSWLKGSRPPYTQATANIRLIGVMTAHFLKFLHDSTGVDLFRIHMIGHSLGAHLAGYVGSKLHDFDLELGRITGLDPAEPHFEKTNPVVRLDESDAYYVDVIHTDAKPLLSLGLGMWDNCGHLDFYPNGGKTMAGCDSGIVNSLMEEDGNVPFAFRRLISCNHIRSYEYFIESINSEKCQFLAVKCNSFKKFQAGNCFSNGNQSHCFEYMGFNAFASFNGERPKDENQRYFLLTSEKHPFCAHHLRISIVLSDTTESRLQGGDRGAFFVVLNGDNGTSSLIRLNQREEYFEPGIGGRIYRYVTTSDQELGQIHSAELMWLYSYHIFNPLTWRLRNPSIMFVNRVEIEKLGSSKLITFCGNDQGYPSGQFRHIEWRSDCRIPDPDPGNSILYNVLNSDPVGNVRELVDYVNPLNSNPLNGLAFFGEALNQIQFTVALMRKLGTETGQFLVKNDLENGIRNE